MSSASKLYNPTPEQNPSKEHRFKNQTPSHGHQLQIINLSIQRLLWDWKKVVGAHKPKHIGGHCSAWANLPQETLLV